MKSINLNSNPTLNELDTMIKTVIHTCKLQNLGPCAKYQQMHLLLFFPGHYKIAHVQKLCPDITNLQMCNKGEIQLYI
jgi:hypothetical protein